MTENSDHSLPDGLVNSQGYLHHERLTDKYDILDTVGTGTFGRVVLCKKRSNSGVSALKVMRISELIRLKQVCHVHSEKDSLLALSHPFIVKLFWAAKSEKFIYLMFEYLPGGELFAYLRSAGHFTEQVAMFYTAEIVSAIDYLHRLDTVYRDLKPENIILTANGHVKLTDFGFAKRLSDSHPRTFTLCGTPEYLAPEVIKMQGHNKAVDWWALGILIYEMVVGFPPFYDEKPFYIYEKILDGKIDWPRHMDKTVKDLIKKLLVHDITKRVGNMKNGANDIKTHKWFKSINWDDVYLQKLVPPIKPVLASETDTSNFEDYESSEDWFTASHTMGQSELSQFAEF